MICIPLPEYNMEVRAQQTRDTIPVVHGLEVHVQDSDDDEGFLMDVARNALLSELLIDLGADAWQVGRMDMSMVLPLA